VIPLDADDDDDDVKVVEQKNPNWREPLSFKTDKDVDAYMSTLDKEFFHGDTYGLVHSSPSLEDLLPQVVEWIMEYPRHKAAAVSRFNQDVHKWQQDFNEGKAKYEDEPMGPAEMYQMIPVQAFLANRRNAIAANTASGGKHGLRSVLSAFEIDDLAVYRQAFTHRHGFFSLNWSVKASVTHDNATLSEISRTCPWASWHPCQCTQTD